MPGGAQQRVEQGRQQGAVGALGIWEESGWVSGRFSVGWFKGKLKGKPKIGGEYLNGGGHFSGHQVGIQVQQPLVR